MNEIKKIDYKTKQNLKIIYLFQSKINKRKVYKHMTPVIYPFDLKSQIEMEL